MIEQIDNYVIISPFAKNILSNKLFMLYTACKRLLMSPNFLNNDIIADNILNKLDILEKIIDAFTPESERMPHGEWFSPEDLYKMVSLLEFDLKADCLQCIEKNMNTQQISHFECSDVFNNITEKDALEIIKKENKYGN